MAKPLLPDELWEIIEPLLPKWSPSPKGGQPRIPDRNALTGILFVLKTGIPWEDLPSEPGSGCGMTCWRRLRDWQADGTWDKIHNVLLDRLRGTDKINWKRAVIDSSSVRAAYGGEKTGPSPVDRAKAGSKHHVLTDGNGIPLTSSVTAANRHDVTELATTPSPRLAERSDTRRRSLPRCWAIGLTTPSHTGRAFAKWESSRCWPRRTPRTAAGWVCTVGLWRGRSVGVIRIAVSGCGTRSEPTSIKRF